MLTIPEVVEKLIKRSPFLSESLAQGIINISALARNIKPEIEKEVQKNIQTGALVMALNRLAKRIQQNEQETKTKIFSTIPDLMVRSNLIEMTFANSPHLIQKLKGLLEQMHIRQNYFLTFTQGIFETTIIASQELKTRIETIFKSENILSQFNHLSSITVQLPPGTTQIPGAFEFILKPLAWEQINLIEVVSTYTEFTMILQDEDTDRAFSIIKRLF